MPSGDACSSRIGSFSLSTLALSGRDALANSGPGDVRPWGSMRSGPRTRKGIRGSLGVDCNRPAVRATRSSAYTYVRLRSDPGEEEAMEAKFEHGLALVRQGLAILEKSSKGEPVGSMIMSPRVAKLGRMAHLHLKALEKGGGRLTLGESREIRRHQLGPKVQSTAHLVGAE